MTLKIYYLLSKTLTVVFLSLFVLINIAFSQEIFRFNKIGLKDGLPSGTAPLSFTQDNIGFIWFPVLGGVVKYDGYEFQTYNTFIGVNDTVFYPEIFMYLKIIIKISGQQVKIFWESIIERKTAFTSIK